MSADPILPRLQALIVRVFGPDRVATPPEPETLLGDGGLSLDSGRLLELVLGCEAEFGVTFDSASDFTRESLNTVQTLAAVIRAKWPG